MNQQPLTARAQAIQRLPGESDEQAVRRAIRESCLALGFDAETAEKLVNGETVCCASEDLPAPLVPFAEEARRSRSE